MGVGASSSTGVIAHELARSFGSVRALESATFEAKPGAITALVGPNGSGKTTLLLVLASLLAPDSGSCSVAGFDPLADPRAVRARLGWMPDVLGAWPSLTVAQALTTTGRMYFMPKARAKARAAELIQLTGLGEFANRPNRVLSRGQKQRLSLARALMHDPEVLLLDEPASGLDPQARMQLRGLLRSLAAAGKTIIVSSHELAELEEITDDAVFLRAGRTVSSETVKEATLAAVEWRLRTLDDAGVLASAAQLFGEHPFRSDSGGLFVVCHGDEDAAALLASLINSGVPVVEFTPAQGRLQRTFSQLESGGRP